MGVVKSLHSYELPSRFSKKNDCKDEQDIVDILMAMWDDAFHTSHPIETVVDTPDQINVLFDSITYIKGQGMA